ncbi:hypothetical protein Q5P01_022363 [Channa striata]|uniref:Uncharacterized protein n=1 Tax=Channa striata TaxID=64152 RepID=A0AA88LLS1_CHASR|nr:hypothetical protein Q5P01_022363 [Channa striata]
MSDQAPVNEDGLYPPSRIIPIAVAAACRGRRQAAHRLKRSPQPGESDLRSSPHQDQFPDLQACSRLRADDADMWDMLDGRVFRGEGKMPLPLMMLRLLLSAAGCSASL